MSALADLRTALASLVTTAGYTLALVDDVDKIPAHEAGRAVIVRVEDTDAQYGATVIEVSGSLSGIVASTLAVNTGHGSTLDMAAALRAALHGASALAVVGSSYAARVIATDTQVTQTGRGTNAFAVGFTVLLVTG